MLKIRDYAKSQDLSIGVSDPHFKELSDSALCCGIPVEGKNANKYFGNYSRGNMTEIVVKGRKAFEEHGDNLQFSFTDWAPEWWKEIRRRDMACLGDIVKYTLSKTREFQSWYDFQRNKWNSPSHFRSPYYYFEGILHPIGINKDKDVIYEYRDWKSQVWKKQATLKDFEF